MSFWKNLLGVSKKETEIIPEPEHELAKQAPDDLMVIKDKGNNDSDHQMNNSVLEIEKDKLNNKDSP